LGLARDLDKEPLSEVVLLGEGRVGKALLCVILLDEVFRDGSRFPESDPSVGVFNGRASAVGAHEDKTPLLDYREANELCSVGNVQLFEDGSDLPWVGPVLLGV
jgi:hypothetical protein